MSTHLFENRDKTKLRSGIALVTYIRTNQNPKSEWRRFAPPLTFWGLCLIWSYLICTLAAAAVAF